MNKRIISLLLCLAMLIGIVPLGGVIAVSTDAKTDEFVNYGVNIGSTAEFNEYFPIPITNNPKDVDNPWSTDSEFISENEVPNGLLLAITNYYCSSDGSLWYKVTAAPGYELPQKLQNNPWIYQDDVYNPLGASLTIHNSGINVIFDANGNVVTDAEIGLYDTLNLTCQSTLTGNVTYQWQICVGDEWVDIIGRHSATIPADYSLFANAMDANKQAQLRCVTRSGSKSAEGEPITITVDTDFDYDNYVHPEMPDEPETPVEPRTVKSARAGGIQPRTGGDAIVCYVTVQYLFQNREQAANSFVAQVPVGVEQTVTAIFPYVQGYLPYYEEERLDELTITKAFTENEIFTVVYKPTEVNYTVDIYFQNIVNDDYSFYDSKTYQGLTGSTIPLNTETFPGMRELLHETPTIAADGSTHVEVYYDRIYYMTRVYLAGGYGIYSVYARYGADLQSHLTAPERPGYSFVGWDEYDVDSDADGVPDTGGNGIADTVYPTVPAKNLAYVALWVENATAHVNVVFWGQNPNDNGYSYLETQPMQVKPGLELTYSLSGGYVCGLNTHTHGNGCTTKCGTEAHTHTAACYKLSCEIEPHTHGDDCCSHTHTITCFTTATLINEDQLTGNDYWYHRNALNTLKEIAQNGYVYRYRQSNSTSYYFLYFDGVWYYIRNYNSANTHTQTSLSKPGSNGGYSSSIAVCNHTEHTTACFASCSIQEHTHTNYTGKCYALNCTKVEHEHIGSCYSGCIEHTHTNACEYAKPKFEGKEYDLSLWELAPADQQQTVTVERDGSTVLNVYLNRKTFDIKFYDGGLVYTISEKWGANISSHWPIKGTNGTTYSDGVRWDPDENCKTFQEVLVYIDIMPAESFSLSKSTSTKEKYTMHYMKEVLPGTSYTHSYRYGNVTRYFTEYKVVEARYSYVTEKEDFITLQGFEKWTSNPAFSGGKIDKSSDTDVYFYYTRTNDNKLEFYSGNKPVRTESVLYEQSLSSFAGFTNPDPPENMEEGSHEFSGWYLNPECTRPADLTTMTMPAGNLALYAKWEPNYHTVRLVLEKKADGIYGPEDSVLEVNGEKVESMEVLHGTIVFNGDQDPVPPAPDNGLYKFLGWFYEDDGVELMWDFEHHPVVKDTLIYAKWSSEVLVPYTIYYKDEEGNDVAEPTVSSSLAGHSLTVEAKVGLGLKPEYREGYFPNLVSHSIELKTEDAEHGVTYTFEYKKAVTKKYFVHYLDRSDGDKDMPDSPVEKTSTYAVVTETFKSYADNPTYKDHVPDAYQKTFVLSSNEEENHIYFYYTKSDTDGIWYVEHLVQNKDEPEVYDQHSNDGAVDEIDTEIKPVWPPDLSKDGYQFKYAIINNGATTKTVTSWEEAKGTVTKEGLSIQVYYDRIEYPYKVVYRNKDTGAEIFEPTLFTGLYGSTVSAPGTLPTKDGYTYDSSTTCTIVKDDPGNITKNIVYVYYTEQSIRLDFKVLGPGGCGTVSPTYTRVKINSDPSATCTATPTAGYKFVGWYTSEACTALLTTEPTLILIKPTDGSWAPTTYYAKFEMGVAPLTIERENGEANQVYVYEIQKKDAPDFVIYVTITGNSSVTIPDMPIADYTITQLNDWSWRYDDSAQSIHHQSAEGTIVTFDDNATTDQWLNGNSQLEKNQRG